MTLSEKRTFVGCLIAAVQRRIMGVLDRTPEDWDGHELRELIAAHFARETTDVIRGRRKRAYRNRCLVDNLD